MTKEEFIKAVEENTDLQELIKGHSYIIQVEVGDMPKEHVARFLEVLADKFRNFGLDEVLVMPTSNGNGCLKFYEVKDRKILEV